MVNMYFQFDLSTYYKIFIDTIDYITLTRDTICVMYFRRLTSLFLVL